MGRLCYSKNYKKIERNNPQKETGELLEKYISNLQLAPILPLTVFMEKDRYLIQFP